MGHTSPKSIPAALGIPNAGNMPQPGKTFGALGNWLHDPSLSNAEGVLSTGDPSLQNAAGLMQQFAGAGPGSPAMAGPQPQLPGATMTALQNQLQQEIKMRASMSLFTGGRGTPGAPLTAGPALLGTGM